MTADNVIAEIYPGAIAWELCTRPCYLPGQDIARAALLHAAEQTALDPAWIEDDTRWSTLRDIVHVWALPDLDRLFDRLVAATLAGFGPMMARSVNELIGGGRS